MDDEELFKQFENLSLPFAQWTHRAHVKVAYLYLSAHPFDQALVLAMNNLGTAIKGLQNLHEDNGSKPYGLDDRWPYMQLVTYLGLHYDHSDDKTDLEQTTYMHRDEVAYSVWAAKHLSSYDVSNANSLFSNVSLPRTATIDITRPANPTAMLTLRTSSPIAKSSCR